VKGRGKGSIRIFHFLVVMLFLFLLVGISHVWVNFKRTQMGYTLSQLKKEILQIEEYKRKLKLEIAFLRSPEHLENKAVKEFGLIHPLPKQIVFLP
jgi:cell division protein FtsL